MDRYQLSTTINYEPNANERVFTDRLELVETQIQERNEHGVVLAGCQRGRGCVEKEQARMRSPTTHQGRVPRLSLGHGHSAAGRRIGKVYISGGQTRVRGDFRVLGGPP